MSFRGSIAPPARPLSTLRCALAGRQRMTRGQRDWLDLRCRAPSSPAPCRFIPTLSPINHHVADPEPTRGSRTEVSPGARAHKARTTNHTRAPPAQPPFTPDNPGTPRLTEDPCTSKQVPAPIVARARSSPDPGRVADGLECPYPRDNNDSSHQIANEKVDGPRGPSTCHLGKCGVQLRCTWSTTLSGNRDADAHQREPIGDRTRPARRDSRPSARSRSGTRSS